MSKKLLYLFIAGCLANIALAGLQSCCSRRYDSDMCSVIAGMHITILDNADSTMHASSGTIPAKATVLALNITDSLTSCVYNRPKQYSLVPAAYAMCKYEGRYGVLDTFIISSNRNFDPAHPAGSNLKDLFYIQDEVRLPASGNFNCYLRNVPADTGTHTFSVHMVMHYEDYNYGTPNNKRVFDASAQPVKLLN